MPSKKPVVHQDIKDITDVETQALRETDFYKEAIDARERVKLESKGHFLDYEMSSDLKKFLRKNRPPTLFFIPQDIASFAAQKSGLKLEKHERKKDYERWEFAIDIPDHNDPSHKHVLALYTGNWRPQPEPYLIVVFSPAEYDGENVIFRPHLRNVTERRPIGEMTKWHDIHFHTEKEEAVLMDFLGLKEHVVKKELEFKVDTINLRKSGTSRELSTGKVKTKRWFVNPVTISLKK